MWDFSIGRSLDLMVKTLPFILFRMAVFFGIAAAYVIVTGTGAGSAGASARSATMIFRRAPPFGAAFSASA